MIDVRTNLTFQIFIVIVVLPSFLLKLFKVHEQCVGLEVKLSKKRVLKHYNLQGFDFCSFAFF